MRDAYRTFMDGAIGTSQGTTYSDAINIGKQGVPIDGLVFYAQITDAVTSAGAATVQFVLEKDTTAAFGSPTAVWDSTALGKATLVDEYELKRILMHDLDWQEASGDTWLRVKKVIAAADLTAGDAFIGMVSNVPIRNRT